MVLEKGVTLHTQICNQKCPSCCPTGKIRRTLFTKPFLTDRYCYDHIYSSPEAAFSEDYSDPKTCGETNHVQLCIICSLALRKYKACSRIQSNKISCNCRLSCVILFVFRGCFFCRMLYKPFAAELL